MSLKFRHWAWPSSNGREVGEQVFRFLIFCGLIRAPSTGMDAAKNIFGENISLRHNRLPPMR
jgi:hypothetical protein